MELMITAIAGFSILLGALATHLIKDTEKMEHLSMALALGALAALLLPAARWHAGRALRHDATTPASSSATTKVNTQRTVLYKLNVVLLKTVISPKVILFHRIFSTITFIMIQQIQENFKSYTHFVRR